MKLTSAQTDRACGVLLASAVGDALGAGYEFGSAPYEGWPAMIGGGLGGFAPGEWTDDTAQTMAIARVAATGADLRTTAALDAVAAGFAEWYANGPADVGIQTIQGIKEKDQSAEIFGKSIPGTGEKIFLQYNFDAKLGIDGAEVKVTETGKSAYLISVPEFTFIGYAEPTFKVAVEDGGVLSWATPDIDKVEMVNEILNDGAQQKYIASNKELLEEQARTFYDSLITSIDSAIVTTFEFHS